MTTTSQPPQSIIKDDNISLKLELGQLRKIQINLISIQTVNAKSEISSVKKEFSIMIIRDLMLLDS